MNSYPKLVAEEEIDLQAGCYVRFVYGGVDEYYPHSHDYYEVFLVAKGIVPHMVNGITHNLPEGSLVFIRPDDVHSHLCNDPESAFINLTFTKETTKDLFTYLFEEARAKEMLYCDMPPMVFLDKTNTKKLVAQINELNTENWNDKNALKIRMRTILVGIFSYFASSVPDAQKTDIPLWLFELTNEMIKPDNFVLGINQMIKLSGKSREHLSRSFKKYYGITITDYINDLRVNYASNLLINTNIPIIDICFNCGFQSASYFYRIFKQKNKISPNNFRSYYKNEDV